MAYELGPGCRFEEVREPVPQSTLHVSLRQQRQLLWLWEEEQLLELERLTVKVSERSFLAGRVRRACDPNSYVAWRGLSASERHFSRAVPQPRRGGEGVARCGREELRAAAHERVSCWRV